MLSLWQMLPTLQGAFHEQIMSINRSTRRSGCSCLTDSVAISGGGVCGGGVVDIQCRALKLFLVSVYTPSLHMQTE